MKEDRVVSFAALCFLMVLVVVILHYAGAIKV